MRRAVLIAGHVLVVTAFAVGLYLVFFGGGEPGGPEVSLDGGGATDSRGIERAKDGARPGAPVVGSPAAAPQATAPLASTSGAPGAEDVGSGDPPQDAPLEIGPPDAQYTSSAELLSMRLATAEP